MKDDYVAEILRATSVLRSGDPAGVTAVIESALAAAGLTGSPAPDLPTSRTRASSCLRHSGVAPFRRAPIECGSR